MSFDNQKKFSNNNPIDFIEEYVLNDALRKLETPRWNCYRFSKGVWKIMILILNDKKK